MTKTYLEMMSFRTFEERFEYLKLNGIVGDETFGSHRYLNQVLYQSPEWRRFRNEILIRDNGCDLAIDGREISSHALIHHINPLTIDDIRNRSPLIFDPNNVVVVSHMTHEAIHYGDSNLLTKDPIIRRSNDQCPWRK